MLTWTSCVARCCAWRRSGGGPRWMGWLWLRALAGRCLSILRFRMPCTQRGVEHYSAVQLVCGFRACATPVSLPAAPLPLQAEAAAANEQAAAVRLGAEAAAEAIRAKAAAEVQAKAVSAQPSTQTPGQIAHHHQAKTRLPCMIAISYNLLPLSLAVSKVPLPHCRRCFHRCRPWRRLSCGSSCLSSSGRRGRQRAPCALLLGTKRSSLPVWRCWQPLLTSWRGERLLLHSVLTHMPGCMRSRLAGRWQWVWQIALQMQSNTC